MEDKKVLFETAKLAKEKGFNIIGDTAFREDDFGIGEISTSSIFNYTPKKYPYNRVTQSLLQKWLRDVHNIVVEILIFDKGFLEKDKFCYQWRVYNNTEDWFTGLEFKTYEESLEEGLQEALKLIK